MLNALKDEGYEFLEATNGKEAIEIAIEEKPSVIIMDGIMPVMDGFEAVKTLRFLEEFKRTPILMISSLSDEKAKLKAIESGASDFIHKPFERMELIMRCRAYMDIALTNSKYTLSTKNPHTHIPNLIALKNRLSNTNETSAILFRIDKFHSVESFYGDEYANLLEISFIKYLINYFQSLDIYTNVYHTAAGEFVLVFDDFDKAVGDRDIKEFCKIIYEHIKLYEIQMNGLSYDVSATLCFGQGYESLYDDISFAHDFAMEKGWKYIIMNDVIADLKEDTKENIQKIYMIKKAIEEDRIITYFQPIYDNRQNRITKHETLVRLVDEDGKVLSPFFFLDVAKKANYYLQITSIVIDNVFKKLKESDTELSINFSYLDINSAFITEKLFKLLKSSRDLARRLIIEILEDETIEDDKIFLDFVKSVKEYGVKIAIDDFGSGYSNYQRVMDISPDFVKIDGSIIKNIAKEKKSFILAKSIHDFSKSLGIKTVGEFVSDEDIFVKLNEIGIDFSQGYYIAEPSSELISEDHTIKIIEENSLML